MKSFAPAVTADTTMPRLLGKFVPLLFARWMNASLEDQALRSRAATQHLATLLKSDTNNGAVGGC